MFCPMKAGREGERKHEKTHHLQKTQNALPPPPQTSHAAIVKSYSIVGMTDAMNLRKVIK